MGNVEDARDITQEVCVRLYTVLDIYDKSKLFATWLYRVTVNLAIDYRRKNRRNRSIPLDTIDTESRLRDTKEGADKQTEDNELTKTIKRIADELPEKQRTAFILRDMQELPTKDVARILGCRPSTVRVHLAKARLFLKKKAG
ncbi:RNA polymerase sigma factor [Candidatus Latescibacterota bacterium]